MIDPTALLFYALDETAWHLLVTQINAATWLNISCWILMFWWAVDSCKGIFR